MSFGMSAWQAGELIWDGASVAVHGSGGGIMEPDIILEAIEKRFLETGHPKDLTFIHTSGLGDKARSGSNRFAHEGMVKRVIAGHWGWSPRMQKLALDNKIEAYNLPQGVIASLFREIAAHRPGLITKVGINTFVDPRIAGGALNDISPKNLIELIEIEGEEWLRYKPFNVDFVIMRGTTSDERFNISMEQEAVELEALAIAQAGHNTGGTVICQVKYAVQSGCIDPMLIKVPGIFIDNVVVNPSQKQTLDESYNPYYRGQFLSLPEAAGIMPLDERKLIARRAAMELEYKSVVNLGFGIPDGVGTVAAEEGIVDDITLSIEQGVLGGTPAQGINFGISLNPQAIINEPSIFDYYSGHGLDIACLGLAQADRHGNVNVSKFGDVLTGAGGFIDITQSAKTVIFCGTFTSGGLKTEIKDGKLLILQEGRNIKFIDDVEHITYSGQYARDFGQRVLYITERAVFELLKEGIMLIEIAPGIRLEEDVLSLMNFKPYISPQLKAMDKRLFLDPVMGLKENFHLSK